MHRCFKFLLVVLLLSLMVPLAIAHAEPVPTTLEFDFPSRLLTIDAETLAALTAPEDALEAAQIHSAWLTETVGEITSPDLMEELILSRAPIALLNGIDSLCVREIHMETMNPDTAGSGRYKFTLLADAVFENGETGTLTFFGRLTKDEAAGKITALRLNLMP